MIVDSKQAVIDFAPATVAEEVAQNVRTFLRTVKYSAPLQRRFGVSFDGIDEPLNTELEADYSAEILDGLREWEPRAQVNDITYAYDVDEARWIPTLNITVKEG